jgi:hypothetical protein
MPLSTPTAGLSRYVFGHCLLFGQFMSGNQRTAYFHTSEAPTLNGRNRLWASFEWQEPEGRRAEGIFNVANVLPTTLPTKARWSLEISKKLAQTSARITFLLHRFFPKFIIGTDTFNDNSHPSHLRNAFSTTTTTTIGATFSVNTHSS